MLILQPYKLYAQLAGAVIALGLIGWGLATVSGWRNDSHKLDAAETALKDERAVREAERLFREQQDQLTADIARDYETELANARRTNAELSSRPVRLCHRPSVPPVPKPTTVTPSAPSEGLHEAPGPSVDQGPDIGGDLYRLALEADECSIRLTQLQGWIVGQLAIAP